MGRRRLYLLIVSLAVLLPGGCSDWQKLPIRLSFDSSIGEIERQAISDAVAEWNERAGNRYAYGNAVFEIVGDIDDTFNEHDYEDEVHAVYRITRCNDDEAYIQDCNRYYENQDWTIGYCTLGDCILILYDFDIFMTEYEAQLYLRAEGRGEEDADYSDRLDRLRYNYVRSLALHELGHMIGITHYNYREGVMDQDGLSFFSPLEHLSDADLDAFCLIYDCRCDDPHHGVYPQPE